MSKLRAGLVAAFLFLESGCVLRTEPMIVAPALLRESLPRESLPLESLTQGKASADDGPFGELSIGAIGRR